MEVAGLRDGDLVAGLPHRPDAGAVGYMAERLTTPWLVVPLSYLDGGCSQGGRKKLLLATTAREAHVYDQDSGTLQTVAASRSRRVSSADNSLRLLLYQESLVRFTGMKQGKSDAIEFVKIEYN